MDLLAFYYRHKEYQRKYHRKRVMKARQSGMCTRCWKTPATDGYKTCSRCRALMLRQNREYVARHGRRRRREG